MDMLRYDLPVGDPKRWTTGQVRQLMARACRYIRSLELETPGMGVFVTSDTQELKREFMRNCSTIRFVEPVRTKPRGVPDAYVDFFALASCRHIVAVSKVSSFAAMAAAVGNSLHVSMYDTAMVNFHVRKYIGDSSPLPSADLNDTQTGRGPRDWGDV
mmetsp:Transcript_12245/g.30844  ORF Transcript_12245/g.30844 Transcript_12245/m.30844 type:complete len:158 (+) Transcript_12245:792-1265(+)